MPSPFNIIKLLSRLGNHQRFKLWPLIIICIIINLFRSLIGFCDDLLELLYILLKLHYNLLGFSFLFCHVIINFKSFFVKFDYFLRVDVVDFGSGSL